MKAGGALLFCSQRDTTFNAVFILKSPPPFSRFRFHRLVGLRVIENHRFFVETGHTCFHVLQCRESENTRSPVCSNGPRHQGILRPVLPVKTQSFRGGYPAATHASSSLNLHIRKRPCGSASGSDQRPATRAMFAGACHTTRLRLRRPPAEGPIQRSELNEERLQLPCCRLGRKRVQSVTSLSGELRDSQDD